MKKTKHTDFQPPQTTAMNTTVTSDSTHIVDNDPLATTTGPPASVVPEPEPVQPSASKPEPQPEPAPITKQRIYASDQVFDHDLYKLRLANMLKNTSWDSRKPVWASVEHVHFFHSITSNGKIQTHTTSIGGHCHRMIEVGKGADGLKTYRCGPPMRLSVKIVRRKKVKEWVELSHDDHTHKVDYVRSDKVKARRLNADFAKMQVAMQARAPLPSSETYER